MRNDEGFDLLVDKVSSFCVQHHIEVINMDEAYVAQGGRAIIPTKRPTVIIAKWTSFLLSLIPSLQS